ncbi:TetR/AcrR family transcriptional regulator [Prauserella cavernicola]|uniref:TetR/AcrR family transcriptional regulator n=1 Tax=Prauserella cavernicola TaxID=2800127 RepID=A0A934V5R8_9PSEU|nr:TetR/AcrR family transcriptional regulator [Prauserella cavernicola]MBK1785440.1 TetR/AcrR family transcriptional regulator [Prauserella cavernicola]
MKLERHTVVKPQSALAATRDRSAASRVSDDELLDAAKQCVLATGVRRTTLAEIARTAEVSRMTLYRRFPDVRSILAALMTREFGTLLRGVATEVSTATNARERLVDSAVGAVRGLVADSLMRTVLDLDAELLLPYVTERLGTTQRFAEDVVRALVLDGQRDGSIRRGEPGAQVRALLLVVQSFVLSLRPATIDVEEEALFRELRHVLSAALTP